MFFGIAWKASEEECREFVDKFDIPYDNGVDKPEKVFAAYRVAYQPGTIFIGADGGIVKRHAGPIGEEGLRAEVQKLIN